jgi:hypothetical protein
MAVTAIKAVNNHTNERILVQNRENPDKYGNRVELAPGTQGTCDMWIPWCTEYSHFAGRHIDVFSRPPYTTQWRLQYAIWQHDRENPPNSGDAVRVSYNGRWDDDEPYIHGDHSVGGNRILHIEGVDNSDPGESLSLQR